MINGYYYLHTNGDLIWRRYLDGSQVADFRESDLVRMFWPLDLKNRGEAWQLLVEALSLGASKTRIDELATKWGIGDADAPNFARYAGFQLGKDGDAWYARRFDFVDLQESPCGFGDTALKAMADLCKQLGYKAQKMWGVSFFDLLTAAIKEKS